MNILILAGGERAANDARGGYPLWLGETGGATILERRIRAFDRLAPARFVFAFRRADLQAFHLAQIVALLAPGCGVVEIAGETRGAACTALMAIAQVDGDAELIVASVTDLVDVELGEVIGGFRREGVDGGLITFESVHPRYSYVRCDEHGHVSEASARLPISRLASSGHYWFARARDFFDAVKSMILKDACVDGDFFVCPALNEMILRDQTIATYQIRTDQYHPLKSSRQVEAFEDQLDAGRLQ